MTAVPRPTSAELPQYAQPAKSARVSASTATVLVTFIVIVAFALRVGAIVYLKAWEPSHVRPMEHARLAGALLVDHSFAFGTISGYYGPSSVQSPTYGFLLAALFWKFGIATPLAYGIALFINAALGAVSVWLTYVLARTLKFGRGAGVIAAAMMAVWPTQVYATTVAQAIIIIVCCVQGAIICFYRAVDSRRLGPALGFGLVGFFGALTEPILLSFMGAATALLFFWPRHSWGVRFRNAIVIGLCGFVMLAPWTLRNYIVHGKLMAVKSQFWWNLHKTNNPLATGTDRLPIAAEERQQREKLDAAQRRDDDADEGHQNDSFTNEQLAQLYGKSEVEQEAVIQPWVKDWMAKNQSRRMQLAVIQFYKTVWYEADNPQANKAYIVSRTILLILFPLGWVLAVAWRRRWLIPSLAMGLAIIAHTLTIAAARFILPHEPFQIALAALVIASLAWACRILKRGDVLDTPERVEEPRLSF